jgi:cytochrome c-type biogenesis protein CcmH
MTMRRLAAILVLLCLAFPGVGGAVQPDEILSDPKLEQRARALSRELRCMVCQNQSIDDSDAPLARDLRLLVRERLTAGDSDRQVIGFLVDRYGEFVLLRPRFGLSTALLWIAPAAVLAIGGIVLVATLRRRRSDPVAEPELVPLSEAEAARLAELLRDPAVASSELTPKAP